MSEAAEILARLADVHEPPAPAEGVPWLLALNLALALLWIGLVVWKRWRRRTAWRREALGVLARIRGTPPERALPALATLLRRVARRRLGEGVAGLDGDAWLGALDACFGTDRFTAGPGRVFGDALYRPGAADGVDVGALCDEVGRMIRRCPSGRLAYPDPSRPSADGRDVGDARAAVPVPVPEAAR